METSRTKHMHMCARRLIVSICRHHQAARRWLQSRQTSAVGQKLQRCKFLLGSSSASDWPSSEFNRYLAFDKPSAEEDESAMVAMQSYHFLEVFLSRMEISILATSALAVSVLSNRMLNWQSALATAAQKCGALDFFKQGQGLVC